MGRGGQGEANGVDVRSKLQEFTWDEVKDKTQRDSRWVVIDGEVYNVTNWSRKHPGGSKVITHYAGQDATDAFRAFHNDLDYVKKFMKPLHIGSLKSNQRTITPIEEDFRELRETAQKMGLFKPNLFFFSIVLAHILLMDLAGWAVMYYYGTGWLPFLISLALLTAVQAQCAWLQHDFGHLSTSKYSRIDHALHYFVMGFMKAQIGWIQHDFGHLSVFKATKWNHLLHYFTVGFIKGASPAWWNHMHYQHHAKPNIMDKDPDVRIDALFVVGKKMPQEIAKKHKKSMPYNWQNYYFFLIGPPLLFPVYFQYMLLKFIQTRRAYLDGLMVFLYFVKFFCSFAPLLGLWGSIGLYFTIRCLESHWFTWVAQSNHIPMEIDHDEGLPWLKLQLQATCNVEKSLFNDWFTGHLNFQIEHHLFPTMPRHNLYKIAPLVKSVCEKHGISYQVKPLSTAFIDIVRSLKHSGELWLSTYQAFHTSTVES